MKNRKFTIHQDVYISTLLLALGCYVFYLTTKLKPASARFPRIALGVFMVLMIWILVSGIHKSIAATREGNKDVRLLKWAQSRMPLALFGITVLYAVGLDLMGFYIASAVFIPVVMLFFRCRNMKLIVAVTAGTLLFVYLMFGMFLHAPLP